MTDFFVCKEFCVDQQDMELKQKEYKNVAQRSIFVDKVYLIATYWTYPFGGGEEFMYDTMEWAHNLGMRTYWISFSNSKNENFKEFDIVQHKFGKILHIPNGFTVNKLSNWIYLLRPDIIHHQGNMR